MFLLNYPMLESLYLKNEPIFSKTFLFEHRQKDYLSSRELLSITHMKILDPEMESSKIVFCFLKSIKTDAKLYYK